MCLARFTCMLHNIFSTVKQGPVRGWGWGWGWSAECPKKLKNSKMLKLKGRGKEIEC